MFVLHRNRSLYTRGVLCFYSNFLCGFDSILLFSARIDPQVMKEVRIVMYTSVVANPVTADIKCLLYE